MNIQEFEQRIQKELSLRFSIRPNPNRPGLNNIFFDGTNYDLPVVPDEIKEDIDPAYRYEFPAGSARMWSIPEVIGRLEVFLKQFESGELDEDYNEDKENE